MSTQDLLDDNAPILLHNLQNLLPEDAHISFVSILHFITLAARLRDNITLVQNGSYDSSKSEPPANLSDAIKQFLAASCDLDIQYIPAYWTTFRSIIWSTDVVHFNDLQLSALVSRHGLKHGIGKIISIIDPVHGSLPCMIL